MTAIELTVMILPVQYSKTINTHDHNDFTMRWEHFLFIFYTIVPTNTTNNLPIVTLSSSSVSTGTVDGSQNYQEKERDSSALLYQKAQTDRLDPARSWLGSLNLERLAARLGVP